MAGFTRSQLFRLLTSRYFLLPVNSFRKLKLPTPPPRLIEWPPLGHHHRLIQTFARPEVYKRCQPISDAVGRRIQLNALPIALDLGRLDPMVLADAGRAGSEFNDQALTIRMTVMAAFGHLKSDLGHESWKAPSV